MTREVRRDDVGESLAGMIEHISWAAASEFPVWEPKRTRISSLVCSAVVIVIAFGVALLLIE
jgi:hypothetical protein